MTSSKPVWEQAADASSAAFFEEVYRRDADPWNFAGSAYELGRYEATLAALAGRRFCRAFEPGCSIGVLTERLAAICGQVDAVDMAETAVALARTRCAHLPGVTVRCGAVPPWPALGEFDLIVLSEIGYYFRPAHWQAMTAELVEGMAAGATLLAVHWTGFSADHLMSGDEVHVLLGGQAGLHAELAERHVGFRLNRWVRR